VTVLPDEQDKESQADQKKGQEEAEDPAVTALLAFSKLAGLDNDDDADSDDEICKILQACKHPLIAGAKSADDLVTKLNSASI
jgi:hypothetical protein